MPTARPTPVVVPAYLIEQWLESVEHFSGNFNIMVYHGSFKSSNIKKNKLVAQSLTRDKLLDGHEAWAHTLIITSYQTLTARHGKSALIKDMKLVLEQSEPHFTNAQRKTEAEKLLDNKDDRSLLTLPHNLRGCFVRVVLDEAHEVRNADTQSSWVIRNLRADSNILLTATPFLGNVEDIAGLLRILRPDEDYLWSAKHLTEIGVIANNATAEEQSNQIDRFDPWLLTNPAEPGYNLRWTSSSLKRHVFEKKMTMAEKGALMRPNFSSFYFTKRLFVTG